MEVLTACPLCGWDRIQTSETSWGGLVVPRRLGYCPACRLRFRQPFPDTEEVYEALRAVPQTFREASLALGASKWRTIWDNVLPYALPGMLTGSILGIGRAAGETAPILLTAAAFFLPKLPTSIMDQVMALPYHLYVLATQHPDIEKVRPMQYGTALVLLIMVLGLNLVAILIRARLRRTKLW